MASAKSLVAAAVLGAPCAAFVAPTGTQVVLRGSAPSAQGESSFGASSAFAVASASAVALSLAAGKPRKSVACKFSKEAQIGAMDPVGFFDPAGLCKDEATFKDFRAKEIKHGRFLLQGFNGAFGLTGPFRAFQGLSGPLTHLSLEA